jgi:alginate O-acetyltransferase complex protein AlgI
MLHFGLFTIATAAWRAAGINAEDLFRQPWRSRSLAEFWSRRWNVGFSDMIALMVHRPVAARLGRKAGIVASFLASGVLHELAISVPAQGGYGLPTLYFALHGALVAAGLRGRVATALALLIPLPLCFHAPFLRAIVIPMLSR